MFCPPIMIVGLWSLVLVRDHGYQSPICYAPLNKIDPSSFSEFTANYNGDVKSLEAMMSKWVEGKYKAIGKLVGMPMIGFEEQCIALLRKIDEER
jgi:hypothetical protein